MKIVAILGSPRGMSGNTGMLLDGMLDAMRAEGAEVTLFTLTEYDVQPCTGCERCHVTGHCPIMDDFDTIQQTFDHADGLVLASPNYIVSVSAQMKALFDRCSGLLHLQHIEGKYAAAVVTSGGPGSDEVEEYMLRFLRMLGYTTVGGVSALGFQMRAEEHRQEPMQAAADLGRALVKAIREQHVYTEQHAERAAMMERMRTLMQLQQEHWPYEYQYWAERERL